MEANKPDKGANQQSATVDHLHAFDLYLGLGPSRSARKTAEALAAEIGRTVSFKTVEAWVTRHDWVSRVEAIEREREAATVAGFVAGGPVAAAEALRAIGAVMRLAESLMVKAATNETLAINSVDDLAKAGKLINDAAKLAEVLNGRPVARAENVASGVPGVHRSAEKLAIDGALAKLNERGITDLGGNPAQHIEIEPNADNAAVSDADFVDVDQVVSEPLSNIPIMRQFEPNKGKTIDGPPAVADKIN
jgi:hypothetical protein